MKKTICIILIAVSTWGLVGCGSKDSAVTDNLQSSKVIEESKDKDSNKTEDVAKENKDASTNKDSSSKEKEVVSSKDTSKSTNISSQGILTKDFKEVSSVEITYSKSSKTYTIEKDGEFIKKVYDSILNTKTTVKNDRDESDPKFIVNIVYKSGSKDIIQSTETGQFIYRVFDSKKSRVGGANTNLINLIKNGK